MLRGILKKRIFRQPEGGFTLIEILVSLLIAGLVVSGLLFLVVELLRVDRRESVLDRTQRDMQRALDYISDDMREAVFVYSSPGTLVDSLEDTANGLPASAEPVLAFWKIQPLDDDLSDGTNYYQQLSTAGSAACSDGDLTGTEVANCRALLIRHGYYKLVIYYTTAENDGETWKGAARIHRYELPEYTAARILDANDLVSNSEFGTGSPSPNFGTWVPSTASPGVTASGRRPALVDYVAALAQADFDPTCDIDGDGTEDSDYQVVPSTPDTSDSFYACVRYDDEAQSLNQDVVIFLKGDANDAGNPATALVGASERSELPTLQTQVLVRGVIDKDLPE